jgi:hypothetical protein
MTGADPLVGIALGIGLGARHALEPDHLAAVSVLAADGPGARRGLLIGALWGLGHTVSLLACGLAVTAAAARIPPRLTDMFEIAVAAMLVALGARALRRGRGAGAAPHGHRGEHEHGHAHAAGPAGHTHVAPCALAISPLLVGAVHGLAGSGALVALATAALPTAGARVAFIALFGFGSVAAMSAVSGVAGWPLARLARSPAARRFLSVVAGTMSVALGMSWAWNAARRLLG